jgi:hypothetical protein
MYGIIYTVSYSYVCVCEYAGDICGLFTCICEYGPFTFECWRISYSILRKVRVFLWMDWEGIIIEDIMDDVYFLAVFFIV